jgi:hypothetical protein
MTFAHIKPEKLVAEKKQEAKISIQAARGKIHMLFELTS